MHPPLRASSPRECCNPLQDREILIQQTVNTGSFFSKHEIPYNLSAEMELDESLELPGHLAWINEHVPG